MNDQITTANILTRYTKVTISTEEEKDQVFIILQESFKDVPKHDIEVLLSVINAQTDKNWEGFESTISTHGSVNITNNNGERLTTFCTFNGLSIENTY